MKTETRLNIRISKALKEQIKQAAKEDYDGNVAAYIKGLIERDLGKREVQKRRA